MPDFINEETKTKVRVIEVAYPDSIDETHALLTKPFMGTLGGEKVRIEIALPRPVLADGLEEAEDFVRTHYGPNATLQAIIDRGIVNGIATAIPWQKDAPALSEDTIDDVQAHMMDLVDDYEIGAPRTVSTKKTIKAVKAERDTLAAVNRELAKRCGLSEDAVKAMITKAAAIQAEADA